VFLTTTYAKVAIICPPYYLTDDDKFYPCDVDKYYVGKYFLVEFIGTFIYASVILSLKHDKIYSE
jgi:hypothetical protein